MVLSSEPSHELLCRLERRLGYTFRNCRLLAQALHPIEYKRLAWLGDTVLKLVLSDRLLRNLPPSATAGKLQLRREALERRRSCAAYAEQLGLQRLVEPTTSPRGYSPRLAEAFEAVLGAVFLDCGSTLGEVSSIVRRLCMKQTEGAAWEEALEEADRKRKAASRARSAGRAVKKSKTVAVAAGKAAKKHKAVAVAAGRVAKKSKGAAACEAAKTSKTAAAGQASKKGVTVAAGKRKGKGKGKKAAAAGKGPKTAQPATAAGKAATGRAAKKGKPAQ